MSVLWSVLIVVAVAAVAVGAMLLVRRHAPDGSYFNDGDRAAGVFGVLATGFALLLGLIVFLAFTSYDESRSGAETEALVVAQQFETAQFLPADASVTLGNQLVCYARNVVHQEWPRMEAGTQGADINPWGIGPVRHLGDRSIPRPRRSRRPSASGSTRRPIGRRLATTASTARPV